ncbi:hypothetical protein C8R47DRAFT_1080588 [Mycena vitilis]|nr:hypothetical protein C8R47DRAFT_1080588 [Mycena vitilis]
MSVLPPFLGRLGLGWRATARLTGLFHGLYAEKHPSKPPSPSPSLRTQIMPIASAIYHGPQVTRLNRVRWINPRTAVMLRSGSKAEPLHSRQEEEVTRRFKLNNMALPTVRSTSTSTNVYSRSTLAIRYTCFKLQFQFEFQSRRLPRVDYERITRGQSESPHIWNLDIQHRQSPDGLVN